MADKKISDFTETTSVAANDWLEVETSGGNSRKVKRSNLAPFFRGALVTKASDQTAANYSSGSAISFDSEGYDTDAIHDAGSPTRLTVPSGASKVRLSASIYLQAVTAGSDTIVWIQKNGVQAFLGAANMIVDTSSTVPRATISTAVLAVTPGDYFEAFLLCADTSITVTADLTWFAMEIIE